MDSNMELRADKLLNFILSALISSTASGVFDCFGDSSLASGTGDGVLGVRILAISSDFSEETLRGLAWGNRGGTGKTLGSTSGFV
jgi:hypothetical protein